jgi:fimbrial chaperone protein
MLFPRLFIAAGLIIAGERSSAAYQLVPISRVFTPTGSTATQSFEINNDGPDSIALTVSISTLERDEANVEINHDAGDDFLIYPPQIVLSPGKSQTLRVTWLGDPKPAHEQAYRLVVQQVPIEQLEPKAKPSSGAAGHLRVMLSYRGSLFVRPPHAAPRITIEAGPVSRLDADHTFAIVVENHGTAAGLVESCEVTLQPEAGPAIVLPASALAVMKNQRVLAGGRRRYRLAWPATLPPGPVNASGRCAVAP